MRSLEQPAKNHIVIVGFKRPQRLQQRCRVSFLASTAGQKLTIPPDTGFIVYPVNHPGCETVILDAHVLAIKEFCRLHEIPSSHVIRCATQRSVIGAIAVWEKVILGGYEDLTRSVNYHSAALKEILIDLQDTLAVTGRLRTLSSSELLKVLLLEVKVRGFDLPDPQPSILGTIKNGGKTLRHLRGKLGRYLRSKTVDF